MKNYITSAFELWFFAIVTLLLISCSGDDSSGASNNTPGASYTNEEREFASLTTNFFKPDNPDYRGIICLGSGNDPMDPSEGSLNDSYLISLSKKLAGQGYLVAIVQYRDQPAVGANWENWAGNAAMLATDLSNVATAMADEYGLDRSKVILGGSSYAANTLISHSAWGNGTFTDIKGIIAIMGSSSLETAQNISSPILSFACDGEPFGDYYGNAIYNAIADAEIKSESFGLTDGSCSGHSTNNDWQDTIVDKVAVWLP